jgi:tyrosine-protein phosphatase SIW14
VTPRSVFGLLLLLLGPGCGVTQVLDRADDGRAILIRSPQPSAGDLHDLHAEHGIRTVLNLRGEQEPGVSWFEEEACAVAEIGARWVHLRVSGRNPPEPEEVEAFFRLVEDPGSWPILMHCLGGVHRTGALTALYRIQYQGWDNARAVEEMEDHWFDWTTRDREPLKEWVRRYRRDPGRGIDRSARAPPRDREEEAAGAGPH